MLTPWLAADRCTSPACSIAAMATSSAVGSASAWPRAEPEDSATQNASTASDAARERGGRMRRLLVRISPELPGILDLDPPMRGFNLPPEPCVALSGSLRPEVDPGVGHRLVCQFHERSVG